MNETPKYPSAENRERLEKLTQEFKPDDVKFLFAMNSDVSIDECRENAMHTISAIMGYVNDNSTGNQKGLNLLSVKRSKI